MVNEPFCATREGMSMEAARFSRILRIGLPVWYPRKDAGRVQAELSLDYLPQVGPAKETKGIQQMDNMGGWDGMPHAKGEPKQKNGLLRFYLENNVERSTT